MTPLPNDNETWQGWYPGDFKMPVSKYRPCFICLEPGYTVPAPPEPIRLAAVDEPDRFVSIRTGDCCPGHEYAVRRVLYQHPEFVHISGRLR